MKMEREYDVNPVFRMGISKKVMANILRSSLFLLLLLSFSAHAGKGEIDFVETTVDLKADGSAVVLYQVQWLVTSGEMHGFYFEGNGALKVGMAVDQAGAVDSLGNKFRLDLRKMSGGKWDVLLANGKGVPTGQTVTYNLPFRTNFYSAGYVGETTAEDGRELVYFNWAPAQWDEAGNQDHYTLKILTPYQLPDQQVDPRELVDAEQLVLTESWVNEKYLIDYQRGPNNRLLLVFHKNRPGNRFHMRVQFYLPASWFTLALPAATQTPQQVAVHPNEFSNVFTQNL
jgi:hypothetical protein